MSTRVLLVEDDKMLAEALRAGLVQDGYVVDMTANGLTAQEMLRQRRYACVLLDLGLPGLPGLELIERVRATRDRTPVVVITGRSDVSTRIQGLDLGADDFLTKPFDLDELSARVRAVTRRAAAEPPTRLVHGGLELDPHTTVVHWHGRAVRLRTKEYAVLSVLMRNRGRVVSRAALERAVYPWNSEIDSNAIEVYVHAGSRSTSRSTRSKRSGPRAAASSPKTGARPPWSACTAYPAPRPSEAARDSPSCAPRWRCTGARWR